MLSDNTFDTMSKKMDDDFNRRAKKMAVLAIIGYIIIFGVGISIGVVGCGRFAPGFIRLFRDHPMVDRVALCDIKSEQIKEKLREVLPRL